MMTLRSVKTRLIDVGSSPGVLPHILMSVTPTGVPLVGVTPSLHEEGGVNPLGGCVKGNPLSWWIQDGTPPSHPWPLRGPLGLELTQPLLLLPLGRYTPASSYELAWFH